MGMTIYFDTCAINRLTDKLLQPRILAEKDAVLQALELVAASHARWMTSEFLRFEISSNPDPIMRAQSLPLLEMASGQIETTTDMTQRAHALETQGFHPMDALHLAVCEVSSVDALLTVDDRLIRRASLRTHSSVTHVLNPIDWLQRRIAWPPR
jgi:predicted nucleic acid-binding protein